MVEYQSELYLSVGLRVVIARYTERVNQKGAAGISTIVVAVAAGLLVFYVGYSMVGSLTAKDIDENIPASPGADVQTDEVPARAQSLVSFDDNFFSDGASFYFRVSDGIDQDGNKTYTYIKADVIADIKTFHKVPVLGGTEAGRSQGGRGGGPAFYMDSQHVYFFTGNSVEIVHGASPSTFQVLSPTYAKDENNVYVVTTTCDEAGNCTGTITVIPGANPDTFVTFNETVAPDPDGSGTVTIDAKDDDNIYYYGTWVGPLPDPDDHSVHPDTDNPVLISP